MDSVIKFFYNIVPGGTLLVLMKYYFNYDVFNFHNSWQVSLPIFLILSLIFGFVFQGLTKFVRNKHSWLGDGDCINNCNNPLPPINADLFTFKKVQQSDTNSYGIAETFLSKYKKNKDDDDNLKRNFYLMHHYVLINKSGDFVNHFHERLAFWSNLYWVSFISLIIMIVKVFQTHFVNNNLLLVTLLNLLLCIFVRWIFLEYLRIFNDSILKTFVIVNKK